MIDYSLHLINASEVILEAFKKLNNVPKNLTLFVINKENELLGTLTDGDIRRGFLKGLKLSDSVEKFMIRDYKSLTKCKLNPQNIKKLKEKGIKLIPILDEQNKILDVIDLNSVTTVLPVDAVLMAGGKGDRLKPLTDKIPKPLLKVGSKTIIEHNFEHLSHYGIIEFIITLRYLGEQIENKFGNGDSHGIHITYFKEEEPLGTIGALSSIKGFKHDVVLLMNADLFTNIDLESFYNDFIESNADMAVATIPYIVDIPYAVLDLNEDNIRGFKEKPTYTYYSNAGVYLIKKQLLDLIPTGAEYNATDFLQTLINMGKKIIRFPILGYWIDIGKPEDYFKAQEFVKHIKN